MQEPFIDLKFFIKLSLIGPSMSDLGPFSCFWALISKPLTVSASSLDSSNLPL